MNITFPSNTSDTIDAIRNAIGRPVTFYQKYKVPCSAHGRDPITGDSLDAFCTICSGVGYIITYSGTTITGHVNQGRTENLQWVSGGQYFDGDATVQIKYTDLNLAVVNNTDHVVVDGKTFEISNKIFRGVPQLNRIIITLMEGD